MYWSTLIRASRPSRTARPIPLLVLLALVAFPAFAQQHTDPRPTVSSARYDSARAKADSAHPHDRTHLYAQTVREAVELADQYFIAGDAEKGHATVAQAVKCSELALEASHDHARKLKDSEIIIRKAAKRLDDVRRTLAFEDRAPAEAAVVRMNQVCTELLNEMFKH